MSSKLDYLKKYMSAPTSRDPTAPEHDKKKKKKKRPKSTDVNAAIRIVDADDGFAARDAPPTSTRRFAREEVDDDAVVLDARGREVDATAALEDVERRAVYMGIKDDGSGWAAVDDRGDGGEGGDHARAHGRHDSDSEEDGAAGAVGEAEEAEPRRARYDSDSDDDDEGAPSREDGARTNSTAPTSTTATNEPRYDSDGDLILDDDGAAQAAEPELQYDSDGDLIIPDDLPSANEELQYDSDGDLIIPAEVLAPPPTSSEDKAKKSKKEKGAKMTDGTSTGLVSAAQVIMEAEMKRKAEQERLAKLSDEQSGRGATTNYRDKATGKLIDDDEIKRRAEVAKPKERERPMWSAGIEQAKQAQQFAKDLEKAKDTPFAHADIDAEFEDKQRDAMRFGDPMAHLSRKKREKESLNLPPVLQGLGISMKELQKSGFIIPQDVPAHSWLRQGIGAPHNRYQIKPGRHWDGVDRGTGFEAKMFKKKNALKERAQLMDTDLEEHNEWF